MYGGEEYAYGMWLVVAFNVGIFLFFLLSFLKPSGSDEWRSMGVVTAFPPPLKQWQTFLTVNIPDAE